ncbi:MAG: DAK2 domain-containing protein [Chloroflexota bacterium]|nr:DAK2 domain-containing protein [Chloroflexota bacterium]
MTISRSMFRESGNTVIDGYLLKQLAVSGIMWLEHNRERVNQLNVFPVPDGDTGTNMLLTMQGAGKHIGNIDEPHIGKLAHAFAQGALVSARGNSGVILSQIWAGAAKALEGQDKLTAPLVAAACVSAVDYAYRAVEKPVEGTILTVAREIKDAVVQKAQKETDLVAILKTMVYAGRAALRKTPEMLPLLKKAGVVDSGGQGLVFIFEGMVRALCGKDIGIEATAPVAVAPPVPITVHAPGSAGGWEDALVPEDEEGYGYDVQFLMYGENMDVERIRADIQAMGWSTLVVGDSSLIKVHVHVHNPGIPLSYGIENSTDIDDIVVENMHLQYQQYVQARAEREGGSEAGSIMGKPVEGVAVITVASGKGIQKVFAEELDAAFVITGGQTMNPSTGDFLAAIEQLPNEDIILLPNNKNVILSARQAAEQVTNKRIRVVPSTTVPQGIGAMIEYFNLHTEDPAMSIDDMTSDMTKALKYIVTGEITRANRDVEIDDIAVRNGQLIGLINDVLAVAGDDMEAVARALLHKADADNHERITLYYGDKETERDAKALAAALAEEFDALDFEIVFGGQPLYPYMIAIE